MTQPASRLNLPILLCWLAACSMSTASTPRRVRKIAILTDRSPSMEDGQKSSCAGVQALAVVGFSLPDVGTRSRLQLFATGDGGGHTLVALGGPLAVPAPVGGDDAGAKQVYREIDAEAVGRTCREHMQQTDVSPLWLSIKEVVAQVRSWGCDADHPCTILVQSDMQEHTEASIEAALAGRASRPSSRGNASAAGLLPPPLDLAEIEVRICGLGASNDVVSSGLRSRAESVWGQLLPGATFTGICQ